MPNTATRENKRGRPQRSVITPDLAWFQARLKEKGLTQKALAGLIGKDSSVTTRILQGTRALNVDELVAICGAIGSPAGEVLAALGYSIPETGIAISGAIKGDGAVSHITPRLGHLFKARQPASGVRALVFEIKHGAGSAYDGATVIFEESPPGRLRPDAFGRLCVVEGAGQIVPLLGVLQKATARGQVMLSPFLPGCEPVSLSEVVRASPVLAIYFS